MALTKAKSPDAAAEAVMNGTATVQENDTVNETRTTDDTNVAQARAQVSATTAIAKASATSAAVPSLARMQPVLSELQNALPSIDWGVLPRLVATQGQLRDGDKNRYGEHVIFSLLSYRDYWVVSPGDDSQEAKEYVRYSDDGVTLTDDGRDVNEYLNELRVVHGYEKAAKKQYTSLIGILEEADAPKEKAEDNIGQMVEVSLSPQSRKSFQAYLLQRTVQVARGSASAEGADRLKLVAEAKSANGKDFTLVKVTAAPNA